MDKPIHIKDELRKYLAQLSNLTTEQIEVMMNDETLIYNFADYLEDRSELNLSYVQWRIHDLLNKEAL